MNSCTTPSSRFWRRTDSSSTTPACPRCGPLDPNTTQSYRVNLFHLGAFPPSQVPWAFATEMAARLGPSPGGPAGWAGSEEALPTTATGFANCFPPTLPGRGVLALGLMLGRLVGGHTRARARETILMIPMIIINSIRRKLILSTNRMKGCRGCGKGVCRGCVQRVCVGVGD